MTPINELGEFALIDRMRQVLGEPDDEQLVVGIADDAAVYRVGDGLVHVITTDALIEGVHFDRLFMPMEYLGMKSVAVNVSDIVAMNAHPRYATIAVGLPVSVTVEMIEEFYRGVRRACELYGLHVVGGDSTAARQLTLSVTVVGEAHEEEIIRRSGARPGDALCVTGDLGGSYAGLKVLVEQRKRLQQEPEAFQPEIESHRYVIQRHLTPRARMDVIEDWAERGVRPHALIDVSDGLASETHHLCHQSGCGALLYGAAIPIAFETRDVADRYDEDVDTYALFGGEDYELLFAIAPEQLDLLDPASYNVVGTFTPADQGVRIQTPEGDVIPLGAGGYQHFGDED